MNFSITAYITGAIVGSILVFCLGFFWKGYSFRMAFEGAFVGFLITSGFGAFLHIAINGP